jgi:hypothetical protein
MIFVLMILSDFDDFGEMIADVFPIISPKSSKINLKKSLKSV